MDLQTVQATYNAIVDLLDKKTVFVINREIHEVYGCHGELDMKALSLNEVVKELNTKIEGE